MGCRTLLSQPSLSRRTSSISCNLVPASLRNPQTLDAYRRRKARKDEGRNYVGTDHARRSRIFIVEAAVAFGARVVTEIALGRYAYRFDTRYIYNNKLIGPINRILMANEQVGTGGNQVKLEISDSRRADYRSNLT